MARIRSIKPEFWTSEQVMECSPTARLMFIGMWNFADDSGRLPFSPKTIKAQIFPGDNISSDEIAGMVAELSTNGLLISYVVDGKEYLQITGWHHQKIDKPQKPKYPKQQECSSNTLRMVSMDTIGEDTKGKDNAAPAASENLPDEEAEFFRRGKKLLGENAGGLIKNLLVAKSKNIPLASAALEQASKKENPREYIGAIIRGRGNAPEDLRSRGEAW
jgi:hypothetical protein